ncbi:hypothetical protein PS6_000222 [Mucor atramentarius]
MFSRIYTGIRSSLNTTRPSTQQSTSSRLSLEDSSEEFVKKSRPILISNHSNASASSSSSIAAIFGLSNNNADDFIQKDLISTSLPIFLYTLPPTVLHDKFPSNCNSLFK